MFCCCAGLLHACLSSLQRCLHACSPEDVAAVLQHASTQTRESASRASAHCSMASSWTLNTSSTAPGNAGGSSSAGSSSFICLHVSTCCSERARNATHYLALLQDMMCWPSLARLVHPSCQSIRTVSTKGMDANIITDRAAVESAHAVAHAGQQGGSAGTAAVITSVSPQLLLLLKVCTP